jgi:hypothetical protein
MSMIFIMEMLIFQCQKVRVINLMLGQLDHIKFKSINMKNKITLIQFLFFLCLFLFSNTAFSQAPEKLSYQSVIRRTNNDLVVNQNVRVKISILQGTISGTAVYVEDHTTSTNSNGLVSLSIGGGINITGSFSGINWENGPYFVKMEADPTGGTNYTVSGTTQLMSVPYALYAKKSDNGFQKISLDGDSLYLSNGEVFVRSTSSSGSSNIIFPTIITTAVTGITSNSATFGGTISNANGNQIMERGVVYSITPNPTLNSNKIVIGNGVGTFDTISALSYDYPHILNPNTTYYVRAYAVTENNISAYGNEVSFTTLSVGQAGPGGGIVFFNKGNTTGGWQYLETATSDQSTGLAWGCNGTSIPGTQLTVGSGETNTSLIVASCNEASFPAKLCDNLSLGGQTDWFLPSEDELNLMYKNLYTNNQGNFNISARYWSSTQFDGANAWCFKFSSGSASANQKNQPNLYVRSVRAF